MTLTTSATQDAIIAAQHAAHGLKNEDGLPAETAAQYARRIIDGMIESWRASLAETDMSTRNVKALWDAATPAKRNAAVVALQ